ncbi:MAG: class I SAM-dependent methyltransferase [Candidatus Tectomicrobia bacterium]|nr:class I SAM-dependent methyltransferase [Candidatus Tectomicrobia bacterium]
MQPYRHRPHVIEARLTAFERNHEIFAAGNLSARAVALDAIQQVYQVLQVHRLDAQWGRHLRGLTQQAKALETRLRKADADFFHTLRQRIRTGDLSAQTLRQLFDAHTPYRPGRLGQVHRGYDTLDALVQGLMRAEQAPTAGEHRDIDMIPYEPTPARAILELVDQIQWKANDVFYDLGAGLGHVTILVHLLTGAAARGVEIEAAYCLHARRCAEELGLSNVRFLNQDARDVDYTAGAVFFMYTPFTGTVLESVLATLACQARYRAITLCTYGACTFEVAQQPWLRLRHPEANHVYALAVFTSC